MRDFLLKRFHPEAWRVLQRARRPARLVTDLPTEEEMRRVLAGTNKSAVVKMILAKVSAAVVSSSDQSSDPPREQAIVNDQIYAGYSAEMRTHVAGGAHALAELLRDLQELTAEREDSKEQPKQ